MLAPPCISNALLIPEKNNTRQVSATVSIALYSQRVASSKQTKKK